MWRNYQPAFPWRAYSSMITDYKPVHWAPVRLVIQREYNPENLVLTMGIREVSSQAISYNCVVVMSWRQCLQKGRLQPLFNSI